MAYIKKLKNGKYKAFVEMGKDPATGKRTRKTKRFNTKKEANAWVAEIIQQRNQGFNFNPKNYTVREYLRRWLKDYVEPCLAPTTYDGYSLIINTHIIPLLGSIKLDELQPMHIQMYFTQKRNTDKKEQNGGLSEMTLLKHFRVLYKALNQAVKWQLIRYNPAKAVEAPKPQKNKKIKALTKEQVKKLLEAAKEDKWMYNFIFVAVYTGMRRSELLGLRWEDIEFENKVIRVRQALVTKIGDGITFKGTKSKTSTRPIIISNRVIKVLREHKKMQIKLQTDLGSAYMNKYNLVFCKFDGTPYYPTTINRKFNKIVKKIGLNGFGIHSLRHTHATLLLQAGEHPKKVQERLGHASITETLDTYSHVIPSMQIETVKKFDKIMS